MSDESFRAVKGAAERILDHYGKKIADAAHVEYQAGGLTFFRHSKEIWITYKGDEIFHAHPAHSGKEVSTYYPDDWIDEVERIDQSITHQG